MNLESIKFALKHIFHIKSWRCLLKYMRAISRCENEKYEESFLDLQWVLDNCMDLSFNRLVYKQMGIIYAQQRKFDEAKEYLLKASTQKKAEKDGELYMWLGYIYIVNKNYSDSLTCFRKAMQYGEKGINKWLIEKEYVHNNMGRHQNSWVK